jgi:hypothetical protein
MSIVTEKKRSGAQENDKAKLMGKKEEVKKKKKKKKKLEKCLPSQTAPASFGATVFYWLAYSLDSYPHFFCILHHSFPHDLLYCRENGGNRFLQTLVPIYQITKCHVPEDSNPNIKVLFINLLHTLAVTIINPILPITVFVLP